MAQISKIGNSVGVTLSRELLAVANLRLGDEVTLVPVQDGIFVSAHRARRARCWPQHWKT